MTVLHKKDCVAMHDHFCSESLLQKQMQLRLVVVTVLIMHVDALLVQDLQEEERL